MVDFPFSGNMLMNACLPWWYTWSFVVTFYSLSTLRKWCTTCQSCDVIFFMQDMTQQIPAQALVAKDLHGFEWHFKHIFRGNYSTPRSVQFCLPTTKGWYGWNFFKLLYGPSTHSWFLINRPTPEAFAYHRVEYLCFLKEISCRGFFCILEVYLWCLFVYCNLNLS